MTRKADRKGPQTVWGRASGEPESSALHDSRLHLNASHNGAPPLRAAGDREQNLVQVRCHCEAVLGVLVNVNRRERTGLPDLLFLEGQVIEHLTVRPVQTRVVQNIVTSDVSLVTDCPAHGRHTIAGSLLVKKGADTASRIAQDDSTKVSLLYLPRRS